MKFFKRTVFFPVSDIFEDQNVDEDNNLVTLQNCLKRERILKDFQVLDSPEKAKLVDLEVSEAIKNLDFDSIEDILPKALSFRDCEVPEPLDYGNIYEFEAPEPTKNPENQYQASQFTSKAVLFDKNGPNIFEFEQNLEVAKEPIPDLNLEIFPEEIDIENRYQILLKQKKRTHKCDKCNYASSSKSALKLHGVKHSNLRPFLCRQCPKAFKTPTALKNHENIHSGRKRHKCRFCKAKFCSSGELARHIKLQ